MTDFAYNTAPWYSSRSSIISVIIEDGVTSIGKHAFYDCRSLTSVTIPDSVTSIGKHAFYYCSSLTSVTIPNSVTTIGSDAFSNCSSLTSVTIGNSVKSIGSRVFNYCNRLTKIYWNAENIKDISSDNYNSSVNEIILGDNVKKISHDTLCYFISLTNITVSDKNTNYSSDNYGVLYNKDKTELIQYPRGNTRTEFSIPDSVTVIGECAFSNCSNLTNVTIGKRVRALGYRAFFGCSGLTSITMPDSLTGISSYAFENCGLTSITIGNGVTHITSCAFYNCKSLTSVDIPNSVTSIGHNAFYGCSSLTNINIPNSVTSIGDDAFYGCSSLTSVTIPDTITNINSSAFENCSNLKSITISNSVTYIGYDTFSGCSSLADVYYHGTEENWANISIKSGNTPLTSATIHYIMPAITAVDAKVIYNKYVTVDISTEYLPENCVIFVVAYKDNKFSKIQEVSTTDGGTLFDIADGNVFKVFVWESLNSMIPICESVEKTIELN